MLRDTKRDNTSMYIVRIFYFLCFTIINDKFIKVTKIVEISTHVSI